MSLQIVPLTSSPYQTFTVLLTVDGNSLTLGLRVYYNEIGGYWLMDVSDSQGNNLLTSIPLITGEYPSSNLLGQYGYLKIGSAYVLNNSGTTDENATYNTLGTDFVLGWDDTAL